MRGMRRILIAWQNYTVSQSLVSRWPMISLGDATNDCDLRWPHLTVFFFTLYERLQISMHNGQSERRQYVCAKRTCAADADCRGDIISTIV